MPNMDGESLIKELNERKFAGPVVVLSALGNDDLIIRCATGAVNYLVKPTSINDLHLAVSNALKHNRHSAARILKWIMIPMAGLRWC